VKSGRDFGEQSEKRGTRRRRDGKMSLLEHLIELRKRGARIALELVAGAVAGWFLFDPAWSLLQDPIYRIASARGEDSGSVALNYTSVTGAFDVRVQIAISIGVIISSPVWLFQIFAFLVPGLTLRERRYALGFFFSAVPLFVVGVCAGWLVLPHIVELMYGFVPLGSAALYETKYYLDFVLKLILATGIAFVLPIFLVLLNFIGVLEGRAILKGWRWAVLAITVFTALATPAADVVAMILLAIPMVMLYFLSVAVAMLHDRALDRRARGADLESRGSGANQRRPRERSARKPVDG
jgi:sec-independent protein translocase protein TatC